MFPLLALFRDFSNSWLVQWSRTILERNWWKRCSSWDKEWKICRHVHTLSIKYLLLSCPRTPKKCTKIYNARAVPLFCSLNPLVLWHSRCRRSRICSNSRHDGTVKRCSLLISLVFILTPTRWNYIGTVFPFPKTKCCSVIDQWMSRGTYSKNKWATSVCCDLCQFFWSLIHNWCDKNATIFTQI